MNHSEQKIEGNQILLMFLGGAPSAPNIIAHWKTMNDNSLDKNNFINKNNFHVVVHPIATENYRIDNNFENIFEQKNIYIVEKDNHVKTLWATRSLSDATLLMMQYAHKKNNNKLFDKYIMLSSFCCPIYTLDKIYNKITQNDKSWFFVTTEYKGIESQITSSKSILEKNIRRKFSQWMILDKNHVSYFFVPGKYGDTYKVNDQEYDCNNKNINYISLRDPKEDIILNNYLSSFEQCKLSDEYFFGTYVYYKLFIEKESSYNVLKETMLEEFRNEDPNYSSFEAFEAINSEIDYEFRKELIKNIEYVKYDTLLKNLKTIPENLKLQLFRIDNGNKARINYIELLVKNENNEWYDDIYHKNLLLSYEKISNSSNISSVQPTYTDWNRISISPFNLLRNFKNFKKGDININDYLNMKETPDNLRAYIKKNISSDCNKTREENEIFFDIIDNNIIMYIGAHPAEYYTCTLRNIVNAYILLYMLYCILPTSTHIFHGKLFWAIIGLYEKIICEEFDIQDLKNDVLSNITNDTDKYLVSGEKILDRLNSKFLSDPNIENKLNNVYGTPITGNTLLEAMASGSLFIRKCYDTSMIETYSSLLKECDIDNAEQKSDDKTTLIKKSSNIPKLFDVEGIFASMLPLKNNIITGKETGKETGVVLLGSSYDKYKTMKIKYLQLKI